MLLPPLPPSQPSHPHDPTTPSTSTQAPFILQPLNPVTPSCRSSWCVQLYGENRASRPEKLAESTQSQQGSGSATSSAHIAVHVPVEALTVAVAAARGKMPLQPLLHAEQCVKGKSALLLTRLHLRASSSGSTADDALQVGFVLSSVHLWMNKHTTVCLPVIHSEICDKQSFERIKNVLFPLTFKHLRFHHRWRPCLCSYSPISPS